LPTLRHLLADVPPPRLFDETLKLFLTGHGERSLTRAAGSAHCWRSAVCRAVDRYLAVAIAGNLVEQLLQQGLRNTDRESPGRKPVTPTFLFALLLYGPIAQIHRVLAATALARDRCHRRGL
jgi:poly(A) polymerase